MVRRYVPKRRPQWRDKDKRMARAVEMRDCGMSIRQIAAQLRVGVATVHRDLQRAERERSTVTPLPAPKEQPRGGVWSAREGGVLLEDRTRSVPSGSSKLPPGRGETERLGGTPEPNVVPIRRSS